MKNWLIILLFGLSLRIILAILPGFNIDVNDFLAWGIRLNQLPLNSFYSPKYFADYTPGFLYLFWLFGSLNKLIPTDILFFLMKLPAISAEILIALILIKFKSKKSAIFLILFSPGLIFNSSIWGQLDAIVAFTLLLSIIYIKKPVISSLLFSLSVILKPYSVFLLPVFFFYMIKNFFLNYWFRFIISSLILAITLTIPFSNNPLSLLINLITQATKQYNYSSLFAYNLWGIFGFWKPDNPWGDELFLILILTLGVFYLKNKLSIEAFATICSLGFFFLPTRIHERYLYYGLIFGIFYLSKIKTQLYFILLLILNLIYFLNLYFVYIYYNKFYLHFESPIFNNFLYNHIAQNNQILSEISFGIFILIFVLVIKNETNKN